MTGDRRAKDALYAALAATAKALGNGRRAELVDVLNQGPRSVEELAAEIGQSVANTSQHLQVLLGAGLVTTRRDGTRIIYSLSAPQVGDLWLHLRAVTEAHTAELAGLARAYLGDRDALETLTHAEFADRHQRGEIVVLDVRPEAEYAAGHIPGALSAPLARWDAVIATLPPDAEFVAYCRGPYCVLADEAVRRLLATGRRAARLADGFPEWRRRTTASHD